MAVTQLQRATKEMHSTAGEDRTVSVRVVESCHSSWVFDTGRGLFRRVLKGADVAAHRAATSWRPFYGLEMDEGSDSFVVYLNPEGTRLLRSWRHLPGACPSCGEQTTELSLDDLRPARSA